MRPVVLMGFEMEAMEYMVWGVAGIISSRLAQPKASSQMISPFLATATDMDGISPAVTASRMVVRTSSKAGFGTVADVGTWPKMRPGNTQRRQTVAAVCLRPLTTWDIVDSRAWKRGSPKGSEHPGRGESEPSGDDGTVADEWQGGVSDSFSGTSFEDSSLPPSWM
jgi:hypothetical protein